METTLIIAYVFFGVLLAGLLTGDGGVSIHEARLARIAVRVFILAAWPFVLVVAMLFISIQAMVWFFS